jgi:hypothetical protein
MNSEPERYIRFQFWLNDHDGNRILFNEWSDGEIDAATVMLPDRIVDLQHWDTQSGVILNHLVDSGWQVGTMPYGVDDEPIPEILPDHETLCEPARAPFTGSQAFPQEEAKPAPQPPPGPGKPVSEPWPQPAAERTASAPLAEMICVLPANIKRSSSPVPATEPTNGFLSTLCGLCLLVLIAIVGAYHSGSASSSAVGPRTYPKITDVVPRASSALPVVRRALPVLTSDAKPVLRALPVEVRRAQLVRLPTR